MSKLVSGSQHDDDGFVFLTYKYTFSPEINLCYAMLCYANTERC